MSCAQGPSGLAEAPSLPRALGGSPGTETPAKLHALCLFAYSLSGTLGAKSRFRGRAVVGEGSRMCVVGLWEEEPSEGVSGNKVGVLPELRSGQVRSGAIMPLVAIA